MAKEFKYRGKTLEELQKKGHFELAELMPARIRRSIKRGLSKEQKAILKKIENIKSGKRKRPIKTHTRNIIILPEMVGVELMVYDGKTYKKVKMTAEMIGHYISEFVLTRKEVEHKAPGVGATRGTKHISVI